MNFPVKFRPLYRTALFVFALTIGCAGTASAQSIRRVDFRNFTYQADCAGDQAEHIQVRNGEFDRKRGDDEVHFTVRAPAYGDLNGDGQDEAVVMSFCNTGGSGDFSEGFVYTMRNGKPVLLTTVPGGDRADGGLYRLSIQRGLLFVESFDHKPDSGACCPDFVDTQRYSWNGHKLVQSGRKTRRNYVAMQ